MRVCGEILFFASEPHIIAYLGSGPVYRRAGDSCVGMQLSICHPFSNEYLLEDHIYGPFSHALKCILAAYRPRKHERFSCDWPGGEGGARDLDVQNQMSGFRGFLA